MEHQAVEQRAEWDAIFGSLRAYCDFLARLRCVLEAAESATDPLLASAGPWAAHRRRAAWIAEDLAALHATPGVAHGAVADFSWARTSNDAAGVAYVLEGSALGGVHLAGRARHALGLGNVGTRYLHGNGKATQSHWLQVKCWLDSVLVTPSAQRQAIAAAKRTFDIYSWAVAVPC